jgi:glycosyltransferase involved in cell wall biosynthesis
MVNEFLKIDKMVSVINGHLKFDTTGWDVRLMPNKEPKLPEVLVITTYPPRECGIATYSQDLIKAFNNKFSQSFHIGICALESNSEHQIYEDDIKFILNTDQAEAYLALAKKINNNTDIQIVLIQHEFGFFKKNETAFKQLLKTINKPIIIVFHTVLPNPNDALKLDIQEMAAISKSIIVMTNGSAKILNTVYDIPKNKVNVIPHGTHLVPHLNKEILKAKVNLAGKTVLSTFGLLSAGKGIETTLTALPAIIEDYPDTLFLVIGKTHPSVVKQEGEAYRDKLELMVDSLKLRKHVRFINRYLTLTELLEYLQLTDIYLFTSKDPNQAVSGTFSYAISCGCAVISTPIPHAVEVLQKDAGLIIDFGNAPQLSDAVISLLKDDQLIKRISLNGLQRMAPTAWENSAIAHAVLFEKLSKNKTPLKYNVPPINRDHIKRMTSNFGMIQFAKVNQPDICTGYTLDDNARALVAICQHIEMTGDTEDLKYIAIYYNFIKFCLQPKGNFLNYVDEGKEFTEQNSTTNLEDSNGRAIWALGYLISIGSLLPEALENDANLTLKKALLNTRQIHSSRAMAFIIKGIYYSNCKIKTIDNVMLIKELANRLVQMYRHEATAKWCWFESYLTYGNSILPEAMLCAYLATGVGVYKEIAKSSFDFLLSLTFTKERIKVISNKGWLKKQEHPAKKVIGGEQPIDVAYTILALSKFYTVFKDENYFNKMTIAFNWFLGNNHLHQIIYNPCTGGCYDGLEEKNVNLNQGAESTVSYLMARLAYEKVCIGKELEAKFQSTNVMMGIGMEVPLNKC